MMSIVVDARYRSETGVGRYISGLCPELEEHGRLQYTFLRHDRARTSLRLPTRPLTVADQLGLALALRRLRPRLFHSPHFLVPVLWRGPVVVSIHDLIPLEYPESVGSVAARHLYPALLGHACARSLRILVPSNATREAILQHGLARSDRIVVIPYGPPLLAQSDPVEPDVAKPILYVGDLKPHKNVLTLLRAFSGLSARVREEAPLFIVGDGPERDLLGQASDSFGVASHVRFLGHVSDGCLSTLYTAARIVVVPSLAEGFGFPAVEAMARGVPVVISDIAALRETTGGASLTFDPRDSEALGQRLIRLIEDDDLRTELVTRGRKRAGAFSWQLTARLTEAAYESALSDA